MNEIKIRVGIDPGKQGFIAINMEGKQYFEEIPTIGKEFDIQEMNEIFSSLVRQYNGDQVNIHCCLENVHAIQGAGATSNFQFGKGIGILEALLVANKIPYTKITPSKWQSLCWEGVQIQTKPNPKNKSGFSVDTKKTSLLAAKRLYPNIDLRKNTDPKSRCRVAHDGKVDALMLLHYCLNKF